MIVALKTPYDDGTSHVVLSPMEFMGCLAALVPKPRVNLTRFHGVFSRGCRPPRSRLREHVVPGKPDDELAQVSQSGKNKAYSMTHRSFRGTTSQMCFNGAAIRIEIEKCKKCGGKVKIIASIEAPEVIEKILKHLCLDEASQARNRSPPKGLFPHSTQLF